MPKQTSTPVERGPGSVSPHFTAPTVSVAQPGLGAQPQRTAEENFRDAVMAFGRGVGQAVSARAAINSRLKALKEHSVNKVNSDFQQAARAFTVRRLEKSDAERRDLLAQAEAGDISMENLEAQLRNRMSNSFSMEESRIWEGSWNRAKAALSAEREEEKQQAFNRAKMTMRQAAIQMQAEIKEDPELAANLKGNGQNIHARVQNHMLEVLQQEADLDSMAPEDAELLIHQTMEQSAAIADGLRQEYQKELEYANQTNASRQLEADLYSTATDAQEPHRLRTQIEETLQDKLGHLTPEQQQSVVRDHVTATLNALAGGEYGLDNVNLDAALELVNMTVNGEKVFGAAERERIAAELFATAEKTIQKEMGGRVSRLREAFVEIVTLPNGEQVTVPATDADARLTDRGETGASLLDIEADKLIREMVGDKEGPEADRLRGIVRAEQQRLIQSVNRGVDKWHQKMIGMDNYYRGGHAETTGAKNSAYNTAPDTRALRTQSSLDAASAPPVNKSEVDHLRSQWGRVGEAMGLVPEDLMNWGGEPVTTDHPLRPVAEAHHANLHNQIGEVPPALVAEKMDLLNSDSTDDFTAFTHFITALDGGPKGPLESFLSTEGVSDSDRAAIIHIRATMGLGRVMWNEAGEPVWQTHASEGVDMEQLRATAQRIQSLPPQDRWLWQPADPTGDDRNATNLKGIAASVAKALRSGDDATRYEQAEWEQGTDDLVRAVARAFTGDTELSQFVSAIGQSQTALQNGLEAPEQAAVIMGWMDRAGYRFKQANGKLTIVMDPHGYTGSGGADINVDAQKQITQRFAPWYREALAEALGVPVGESPQNLQELNLFGREGLVPSQSILPDASRPLTPAELAAERERPQWVGYHGATYADNQMRLLPTEAGGGSPVYLQSEGGVLASPSSKSDVTVTLPNGETFTIAQGQALSVYNPAFFVPFPRQQKVGQDGITPRPAPQPYVPPIHRQVGTRPTLMSDLNRPQP
jgi:hypothetical protein